MNQTIIGKNENANFSKYGKSFQEKLCMVILDDRAFADQIEEVLDINFLELNYLKLFLTKIFSYREKYGVHPSRDIMKTILRSDLDAENELTAKQVREFYVRSQIADLTDVEYIKDTSLDFCKKQNLKSAMVKSIGLLQNSSYDEISQVINDSLKLGMDNDEGYDWKKDFEERFKPKFRNPISTGWDLIDNICKGGLGQKELGVVIAPTGAGKSMVLVHLGTQALKAGKTVVHYTLELQDTVIASRYDSCLTKVPLGNLMSFKEKIYEEVQDIEGRLIVKEYPTKSATTHTIKTHLEKLKMRNINVDMIIVDYADLLRPVRSQREKRNELETIYEELRGIASEMECPIWTASQTNRCFWTDTKLLISRNGKSQSMRIGDVIEGDMVETHKGLRKITKVFPQEEQQTYKITLKSGKTMVCSGRHQFPTASGELKTINEGLSVSDKLLTRK